MHAHAKGQVLDGRSLMQPDMLPCERRPPSLGATMRNLRWGQAVVSDIVTCVHVGFGTCKARACACLLKHYHNVAAEEYPY